MDGSKPWQCIPSVHRLSKVIHSPFEFVIHVACHKQSLRRPQMENEILSSFYHIEWFQSTDLDSWLGLQGSSC